MERPIGIGEAPVRGFTYLSLLFFLAVLSVGLAAVAISWQTERQRQREAELLFAGGAIRDAIALYYDRSPGAIPSFPKRLADLLQDPRYPDARRYLRRLYRDPMTGQTNWGIVPAPDGGIMGVHSLGAGKPLKVAGSLRNGPEFSAAATYADWQFVYVPAAMFAPADAGAPPPDAPNALPTLKSVDPSSLN